MTHEEQVALIAWLRRPRVAWSAVTGAAKVAVVVLGRHFDRSFGSGETYYQQAKARKFTWDSCCLEAEKPQA